LWKEGKIKIVNKSIFDYTEKSNDHTFVVGFEILDNMPHDRLYTPDHPKVGKTDSQH
jgi:hypothetical protein